ncbi:hypothetical protein F4780DRAFT_780794 [Xylariomycetidae sp. FL0641]|nr:hypothetical protein F4780DRAFT_780794 [Xylariomycetidae sp. FL0641]
MASNDAGGGSGMGPPPAPPRGRLAPLITPRAAATPNRRTVSIEPPSARLSASARRFRASGAGAGATPHARAAIRAIDQRRAALFTPGRNRRRSLREQRETPRDLLRNLSRRLAATSAPIPSSPPPPGTRRRSASSSSDGDGDATGADDLDDDDDDDFPIERPRFSLPLGPLDDDDDDDFDLKPPRSSGLENLENYTVQSIELPRRAISETPLSRFDRESLGMARMSDYMGPEVRSDDAGIDSGFFPPPALDDTGDVAMDEQAMIERFDADEARRQTMGRESDFGTIQVPDMGNESTFMMDPIASPSREFSMNDGLQMDDDDGPQTDDEPQMQDGLQMDDDGDMNEPFGAPEPESDSELMDATVTKTTDFAAMRRTEARGVQKSKPGKKISRHGIEYKSLPPSVVKRLATTFAKTAGASKAKISPETLNAIMQATDWFFEQLGDDLGAYARHAGRKTIDESDMVTLMRRQRQTNASTTPFALAQRYLPRELLQELRMPVPVPSKAPRKKAKRAKVDGEEVT